MKIYKIIDTASNSVFGDDIYFTSEVPEYAGFRIDYTDSDARPFGFGIESGNLYIGDYTDTHGDLCEYLYDECDDVLAHSKRGRIWEKIQWFALWGIYNSSEVKEIVDTLKEVDGELFDLYDYTYPVAYKDYIIIFTVGEYINMGINANSFFTYSNIEGLYRKQEITKNIKYDNKRICNNGLSYDDVWRHYSYVGENRIRLKEDDIRDMVYECLNRLKEK